MNLTPVRLDLEAFRATLRRRGTPKRVQYFEHGIDAAIKREMIERFGLRQSGATEAESAWREDIALHELLGMEVFRVFPPGGAISFETHSGRGWADEHAGPISSWETLERFPWPDPKAIDYSQLEWYEKNLPPDMGVVVKVSSWEITRELFGFEPLCYKLFEDPELVRATARRVGEFYSALARALCDFRCVFAVYGCDDFGYKTATMIRPETLREIFLPWHREWAAIAHGRGKFYFLHACGRLDAIIEDLISDVRVDAKHSFEEAITPVPEAKRLWGGRLTLLGGLDIDRIARDDEQTIRDYTRRTLTACIPGGGYFLGLGNWVTAYTPIEHYLWVLDEGRKFRTGG